MLKVPVNKDDHIQGPENAIITLVEYGDYQCPHCKAAHPIVKQIQKQMGDNLRFVFRNFPLSEIHPMAMPSAEMAEFAATYNLFWEMHDLIYENQSKLSSPYLLELAKSLNLPEDHLKKAIENHIFENKIKTDFMTGLRSGVNGTPTFFINNDRHIASYEYNDLIQNIETQAKLNNTNPRK